MLRERFVGRTLMVILVSASAAIGFGEGSSAVESIAAAPSGPPIPQMLIAQATAPVGASAATVANATAGQDAFMRQCRICHTVVKGGEERFGPNLFGVVGRQAGTEPNFVYSDQFKKSATWKWDPALIGGWISNPGALIPGNAMAVFQGVADRDRDNIIAFLATLK